MSSTFERNSDSALKLFEIATSFERLIALTMLSTPERSQHHRVAIQAMAA
jgi:hypothetical protein